MSENPTLAASSALAFSNDGYIRMSFERFCALRFATRKTFFDEGLRRDLEAEDVPARVAGFCEWVDLSNRVPVSVEWAWFRADEQGAVMLAPGGISTNVMLTAGDRDLGVARTNELMRGWLSKTDWQRDMDLLPDTTDVPARHRMN